MVNCPLAMEHHWDHKSQAVNISSRVQVERKRERIVHQDVYYCGNHKVIYHCTDYRGPVTILAVFKGAPKGTKPGDVWKTDLEEPSWKYSQEKAKKKAKKGK